VSATGGGDAGAEAVTHERLAGLPTVFRDGLLAGQVVLVTGGGGGIGRAICYLFGRLGAAVVACGRDPSTLARLEEGLGALGVACLTRAMTIRDPEQVSALIDAAWERFGRLDVLINNAGGQFAAPALDISPKGWHAVVETNLTGTWYTMQAAARRWRDRGQPGVVINITVPLGRAKVGIAHTMASRAGQTHLSRTLAVEWAPYEIRVNCVALGVFESPGLDRYPATARPSFAHNPMRRPGDVHDVAEACVYLAAPSGRFITGTVLTVDGGGEMWGEFWPLGRPDYFRVED
jgi:NAD(P)-dependent dehydrogenase (short-subunit alcohol dehydrogenase family)